MKSILGAFSEKNSARLEASMLISQTLQSGWCLPPCCDISAPSSTKRSISTFQGNLVKCRWLGQTSHSWSLDGLTSFLSTNQLLLTIIYVHDKTNCKGSAVQARTRMPTVADTESLATPFLPACSNDTRQKDSPWSLPASARSYSPRLLHLTILTLSELGQLSNMAQLNSF